MDLGQTSVCPDCGAVYYTADGHASRRRTSLITLTHENGGPMRSNAGTASKARPSRSHDERQADDRQSNTPSRPRPEAPPHPRALFIASALVPRFRRLRGGDVLPFRPGPASADRGRVRHCLDYRPDGRGGGSTGSVALKDPMAAYDARTEAS